MFEFVSKRPVSAESVGLKQAKLVIPAFTKGKSHLHPVEKKNRGIASVQIHVERTMGLLWNRYTILEGTVPTDFLVSNRNGSPGTQILMINRIVRACSAPVNLFPANSCPFSAARSVVLSLRKYPRGSVYFLAIY